MAMSTAQNQSPDGDIAACLGAFNDFGGVLKLILDDEDAPIFVDGRTAPPRVSATPPPDVVSSCSWRCSRETLRRLCSGGRALESAYISRRLQIGGDFAVMARLELKGGRP
ncbi:MAG: hypothetical protein AAGJ87_15505 [Pseudomonadota bacterium]